MPLPTVQLGTVALDTPGRLVDTYSRPGYAPQGPSVASALAEALQGLQPGITAYFQQKQAAANADAQDRGRKAALEDGKNQVDAIQAGNLYPQESSFFQAAYKQQKGQLLGQRWRGEAEAAYNAQGLQSSTDPQQFDTFMADFVKQRMDGIKDPDLLHGALGVTEQTVQNLGLHNATQVATNLQSQYLDDAVTTFGHVLDDEITNSLSEKRDFNPAVVQAELDRSNAAVQFLKLDPQAYRKKLTDLVVSKAVKNADERYLQVLDGKFTLPDGRKVPITDAYWKEIKDDTQQKIDTRKLQIDTQLHTLQERKAAAQLEQTTSDVVSILGRDPFHRFTPEELDAFEEAAPGSAAKALDLQGAMAKNAGQFSTGAQLNSLTNFLKDPSNPDYVAQAVSAGIDVQTFRGIIGQHIRAREKSDGHENAWKAITGDLAFQPYLKRFDNAATDPILGKFTSDPQALARGQALLNADLLDWTKKNPDATTLDKIEHIDKAFDQITSHLQKIGAGVPKGATPAQTRDSAVPLPAKKPKEGPSKPDSSEPIDPEDTNPFEEIDRMHKRR